MIRAWLTRDQELEPEPEQQQQQQLVGGAVVSGQQGFPELASTALRTQWGANGLGSRPVRVRMVGQYGAFGGVEVIRAYWSPQLDEVAYDVIIPGVESDAAQRGVPASALRPYPGQELPLPPSYQQAPQLARIGTAAGGGGAPGSLLAVAAAANAARPTAAPSTANGLPWQAQGLAAAAAAAAAEPGVGSPMATMKGVMFELAAAAAAAGAAAAVAEASQQNQVAFVEASNAQLAALQENKAAAIAAERFEEAARLRDGIAALRRAQLTANPSSGLSGLSAALLGGSAAAAGQGEPEAAASPQEVPEVAAAPAAAKLRLRGAVRAVQARRALPPRPEEAEPPAVPTPDPQASAGGVGSRKFRGAVRAVQAGRALPPRPDATEAATPIPEAAAAVVGPAALPPRPRLRTAVLGVQAASRARPLPRPDVSAPAVVPPARSRSLRQAGWAVRAVQQAQVAALQPRKAPEPEPEPEPPRDPGRMPAPPPQLEQEQKPEPEPDPEAAPELAPAPPTLQPLAQGALPAGGKNIPPLPATPKKTPPLSIEKDDEGPPVTPHFSATDTHIWSLLSIYLWHPRSRDWL